MPLSTAYEIWLVALQTYCQIGNDAQVYEPVKRAWETKQGEKTVAEYYVDYEHYGKKSTIMRIFKLLCSRFKEISIKNW